MKRLLVLLMLASPIAAEPPCLLEGPEGLGVRVAKYLLDAGVDPATVYRSGDVVVRRMSSGMECVTKWGIAAPVLPAFDQLPSFAESRQVLDTPSHDRVFDAGKWRVKTPAEQGQSPEGRRAAKRVAARDALVASLRSAGFTNATFSVDDVQEWLETASMPANQEKQVLRRLDKFQTLARPPASVVE